MGKTGGFLEFERVEQPKRSAKERVRDFRPVDLDNPPDVLQQQGARCMDCGIPFCHSQCPLGNLIPDWNDLVYRGQFREALTRMDQTNNFPEFTGILCPAICEAGCVLGINRPAVAIRQIEWEIARRGFEAGFVVPQEIRCETGKSVAIIGSGPAGLTAAQQLRRKGHRVLVYEKNQRPGGILRYGIPDFKLAKSLVDRRLDQLRAEGVEFRTGVEVGRHVSANELKQQHDTLLLCCGSEVSRDLPVPGRELRGIHFAMDFLRQQNKKSGGEPLSEPEISATGKHVAVIGGGDTGSDCIGTAHRQGAISVTNIELMPQPPVERSPSTPWPTWPLMYRSSTSHEEGGEREFAVLTKAFRGDDGTVQSVDVVRVRFETLAGSRPPVFREIDGSQFSIKADLVLLALGFLRPQPEGLLQELGLALDARGNVAANTIDYMTNRPGIFVAGDSRRGQSLVVWAMAEGRAAAEAVHRYLELD
jgi:glutamate synthase (NADPH/NADH) small chain